jgi:hypothetical protein
MVPLLAPCNWISSSGQNGVWREGESCKFGATLNVKCGLASALPATAGMAFNTLRRSIFICASIFLVSGGLH